MTKENDDNITLQRFALSRNPDKILKKFAKQAFSKFYLYTQTLNRL